MKTMTYKTKIQSNALKVRDHLLAWYDASHRQLPWRHVGQERRDPYPIWVSEIMLQQTTVQTVETYFVRFMKRWPTLESLAGAPLEDVLTSWQGLGYYHRAKNLHKTAQLLIEERGGMWPSSPSSLEELPGIGSYTSRAIAAIAFQQAVVPVDGNIKRVMSRLHNIKTPLDRSLKEIESVLQDYASSHRPGDFAQALMDLGARICVPKRPQCLECPLQMLCEAHLKGLTDVLPVGVKKTKKPEKVTNAYVALAGEKLLMRVRPDKGLLAHMMEVPTAPWLDRDDHKSLDDPGIHAPTDHVWRPLNFSVTHVFTHFKLIVHVYGLLLEDVLDPHQLWVDLQDLPKKPLPTLMKKIIVPAVEALKKIRQENA